MFKRKILIGKSEDAFLAIFEHLEKSNVPYEIGIQDILKQSSERFRSKKNDEIYKVFYGRSSKKIFGTSSSYCCTVCLQEDVKLWYVVAKKKSRKLEKKEHAFTSFVFFIHCMAIQAIETSKSVGANTVSYIACDVSLMCGMYRTTKYYKEMKKESIPI